MKKLLYITAALVLMITACAPKEFTFVQLTDMQIGFKEKTDPECPVTTANFKACIAKMNELKPDFIIITGDLLNNPEYLYQKEKYDECISALDKDIAVYAIPGNHDMRPYNDTTRRSWLDEHQYERFSFVHKNSAFIGLDSNCIMEGAEQRAQEQWDWLVEELRKASGCDHRFLFIHCPVVRERIDEVDDYFNFPMDQRRKYVELCNEYKVDAFFSGHTHKGYDAKFGCTEFVNVGPVGPGLDGGCPGYNVVTVSPDSWTWDYRAL